MMMQYHRWTVKVEIAHSCHSPSQHCLRSVLVLLNYYQPGNEPLGCWHWQETKLVQIAQNHLQAMLADPVVEPEAMEQMVVDPVVVRA